MIGETLAIMMLIFVVNIILALSIALWLSKVRDDILEAIKETKPENAKRKVIK
jgi:hypothetical protein